MASAAKTALKPFSLALAPFLPKSREDELSARTVAIRFVPKQLTSLQADFPFTEFLHVS